MVSGAAYGIDVAAHRGALAARGPTVAVLACGADRVYPAGNQHVIDYIARTGLVVSELPPGCAPTKLRFLSRNRHHRGAGAGAPSWSRQRSRSGALNTANWANRLGRVVMGVPGPVTSAPSEGVHELLRTGEAQLVTRGAHVLELVSPAGDHLVERPRGPETRPGPADHRCSSRSWTRSAGRGPLRRSHAPAVAATSPAWPWSTWSSRRSSDRRVRLGLAAGSDRAGAGWPDPVAP